MTEKQDPKFSGAPITMHKQGKLTDAKVLEEVQKKPGSTVSEIAESLDWSNGKIDGSLNRLSCRGKIVVKHFLKNRILIKRAYPEDYQESPRNIIELPFENTKPELWRDCAYVYALSRSTIGLSPVENKEWAEKSLFNRCINFRKDKNRIDFMLPEKLEDFYQLENSEVSVSTLGDIALAIVESTLPIDLPPTYPEERFIAHFRTRTVRERFEVTSLGANFVYLKEGTTEEATITSTQGSFNIKKENKLNTFIQLTSDACNNKIIDIKAEVR